MSGGEKQVYLDDQTFSQKSSKYIGVLKYVMADAKGMQSMVDGLAFDEKSLVKVTKKYHEQVCDSIACIDYTKVSRTGKDMPIRVKFSVMAGADIGRLRRSEYLLRSQDEPPARKDFDRLSSTFQFNTRFTPGLAVQFTRNGCHALGSRECAKGLEEHL